MTTETIKQQIQKNRKGTVRLTIQKPNGKPLANREVSIGQTRHQFLFGCNIFRLGTFADPAIESAYRERFENLLNYATLPFYWSRYEPAPGETQVKRITEMAQWCAKHNITVKGHPMIFHGTGPKWIENLPFAEFKRLQFERITREISGFAGLVDIWDVVNEAVWTPGHLGGKDPMARICRRMGRIGMIKHAYALARAANPKAKLIINDCDPVPKYARILRDALAAKAQIDIVGIQSHMHKGYWPTEKTQSVCDEYSTFGKPIQFSELTILSGIIQPDHSWNKRRDDWFSTPEGEELQARQVSEFYSMLYAHPGVAGITWWDFTDDNAWLGAPGGLLRKDMSPKPAYTALLDLVKKQWWTPKRKLMTDAKGQVDVEGFLGDYEIVADGDKAKFAIARAGRSQQRATLVGK